MVTENHAAAGNPPLAETLESFRAVWRECADTVDGYARDILKDWEDSGRKPCTLDEFRAGLADSAWLAAMAAEGWTDEESGEVAADGD